MNCKDCKNNCCIGMSKLFWHGANITKEQLEKLKPEMTDDGNCQMLKDNECLIHKYFGYDAKPDYCKKSGCEDLED